MDEFLITPGANVMAPAHGMNQYTQEIETNVERRDLFRVEDTQNERQYRRLFDALYFAIQDMLGIFNPSGQDTLSVTLEGKLEDDSPIQIGLSRQSFQNFTVDRIVDTITQKLQSAQTLQGRFTLIWVFYRERRVQLLGQNCYRGDWKSFVASKHSFVQIHPKEDPYSDECFPQWIVMGLSFWIHQQPNKLEFLPTRLNYLRLSSTTYKNMIKRKKKFITRHLFAERLKECFSSTFPILNLFVLSELEQILPIRFCLYGFTQETKAFTLVYPPASKLPYNDEKFTVYGVCQGTNENAFVHVDFIPNPDAIDLFPIHIKSSKKVPSGRVCRKCFQFYISHPRCKHGKTDQEIQERNKCGLQNSQSLSCPKCHICEGCCSYCLQLECVKEERVQCVECLIWCNSQTCLNLHVQSNCTVGFRKPMQTDSKCPICGDEHENEQGCFLKRTKLKKPSTQYAVYDFECCFDKQQRHIPYCVTCCFPYSHARMKELQQKYPFHVVQNQVIFVFWGVHTEQFWEFIADPLLKNTIFFAHNGRAYDSIIVKSYLWKRKGWISEDICRGRKFLQVAYPKMDLIFRDSLCFIPTSLRSMSSDFGIEEFKKGHFPHKWMTLENVMNIPDHGMIQRPGIEYFDFDFRSQKDREEAKIWVEQFLNECPQWNIKQDAIDYCISDTLLLSETLRRFRDETMQMCETIERPPEVEIEPFDPFQYMTLASAMMSFYFGQCLPEQTIACIDRYEIIQEAKARAWIHSIGKDLYWKKENREGCTIVAEDETCYYAFYSCELHGCLLCFPRYKQGQWHPRLQCTYEMARKKRETAEQQLDKPLIVCWEHDYHENEMDECFIGIDPRDAYKGGKTELYKLTVPQECAMVDFVSQYPTVCFGESIDPLELQYEKMMEWDLPIGQPQRFYRPQQYDWDKSCLGIAKVKVLPPQNCYAPFLSFRTVGVYGELEVVYGCCKTCMQEKSKVCNHTPKERSFVGTWTLTEIRYARSIGYEILEIVEVWEYPKKSNTLFRSFIVPFMYHKIVSKTGGCVDHQRTCFTEKGKQVAAYLQHIMKREIHPSEFSDSPARRTVAKLIQNAFTGKWGQRDAFSLTRSFTDEEAWNSVQILNDPNVEILSAIILPDQCVTLTYEKQKGAALHGIRKKNDHIVAHITAYGRMMLNRVEQALGNRLVYVDTDSAYHQKTEEAIYRTGFRTGDLELECDSLKNWVGLARKSYAYETKDKVVVKQKGIAMKSSLETSFSPKALQHLIESTKRKMDETDVTLHTTKKFKAVQPLIKVPQMSFKTEKSDLDVYKETQLLEKVTRLNVFSCKRIICWNSIENGILDTLPFGYRK